MSEIEWKPDCECKRFTCGNRKRHGKPASWYKQADYQGKRENAMKTSERDCCWTDSYSKEIAW